jgi:NodT family efflux transporter outer membrane factor (OMF) lipoprotein
MISAKQKIGHRVCDVRMRKEIRAWSLRLLPLVSSCLSFAGCNLAPKYSRPAVAIPGGYKEIASSAANATNGWKVAQPMDGELHGDWWEMYQDPQLNALEAQVSLANQDVATALANLRSARAIAKEARAQLFPTLTTGPSITRSRGLSLGNRNGSGSNGSTITDYSLPFDASWQLDLWGRIRNTVNADIFEAQATAADLENIRLTAHAEVAVDYFELRAQDALRELFDGTVAAYQQSFDLTKVRFETGIASDEDVAQAETQLKTAQAQATNLGIMRAQFEHALALLIGKPASVFSLPNQPLKTRPPTIPSGIPSEVLERRPDIAAAERRVAEANAQIGVAKAAYYPTVTLSASAGFESSSITSLLNWSSRVWSAGAGLGETLFDAGQRKATVEQFRATYDSIATKYRQTVLNAFREVEDNLAALRILAQQIDQQEAAIKSSERFLSLAEDRYKLGIDSFLNVISAQTILLANRQTAVNLRMQQMTASVQLVEALGGGWDAASLPSRKQLLSKQ